MTRIVEAGNYQVVTRDKVFGERTWYVKVRINDAEDASSYAAKAAAIDLIPAYEAYTNDSIYLDDLDRATGMVEILSVVPATGPDTGRPITYAASLLNKSELNSPLTNRAGMEFMHLCVVQFET